METKDELVVEGYRFATVADAETARMDLKRIKNLEDNLPQAAERAFALSQGAGNESLTDADRICLSFVGTGTVETLRRAGR